MKAYVMWHRMIAKVVVIATLLLSTQALATDGVSEDAFALPALSLSTFRMVDSETGKATRHSALTDVSSMATGSGVSLLHQPPEAGSGFLDVAAAKRRRAGERRDEEEIFKGQYMGTLIMITGGALVVIGGIGLVTASSAPAGMSGTITLLSLGALAGGGFLIYWGYQYKEEAAALASRTKRSPLMVGYAFTF